MDKLDNKVEAPVARKNKIATAISGILEKPKLYVVRPGDTWESIAKAIGFENGNFLAINLFGTKPDNLVGKTVSHHQASHKLVIGHTWDQATVVSVPPSVQTIQSAVNDSFYRETRLAA